jgi:hypothetical protein
VIVEIVTYRVRRGREEEFEKHQEERTRRLRRAGGFVALRLLRNAEGGGEYRAEVRWAGRDYRDRAIAPGGPADAAGDHLDTILEAPPDRHLFEEI